jgi:two-component system cell cycle sensor histidine kinase/response regulator CckA
MQDRPTILVVDDDADLCHLIRLMLQQSGYTVLSALHGEAALLISREHRGPIDLLLADIAMIGMSGPQLAQCLRETRPALRFLFMSGLVTEKNFQGVLGAGFLSKPFTPAALVEKIEAALYTPSLKFNG